MNYYPSKSRNLRPKINGHQHLRNTAMALCLLITNSFEGHSAPVPFGTEHCGSAKVAAVTDGETLISTDGETIKLAGVMAPELWPENTPYSSWPYAEQSRKLLGKETLHKTIELFCEGETITFDGAKLAHILLPDGHWLQERLVLNGTLYVFPRSGHISGTEKLYAAEHVARAHSKGLWAQSSQTLTQANGDIRTGWFQIIEGKVLSAQRVGQNIYLNFDKNWRTDFTIEIPAQTRRGFEKTGLDPLTLEGQALEVRGWVDWKNGPRIVIESPGQIRAITMD